MDYRRYYGLRAPRPIGGSTFLAPQLENYSLFTTPFLDLNKKISKLIDGIEQDATSQSEKVVKAKGKVERKEEIQSEEKKSEQDEQKLPEETREGEFNFGIVLNVVTVEPEELTITFGEGNEIEVKVNQSNGKLEREGITFSRNCSYKYELPDDVDKNSLVAVRTSDDYLIILPLNVLREDLLKKSVKDAKDLAEPSDKETATSVEATESADLEEKGQSEPKGAESKESKPKESASKEKKKVKTRKGSKLDSGEATAEEVEESSKSDMVFINENGLVPVLVTRMLRPGMDIFMLRKYVVDLESYVSTVRKFIENASFISRNSKTPEILIRSIATELTDAHFENRFVKGERKKKKIVEQRSTESGYTSSEKSSERLPDASGESSRSSTPKSGEQSQETTEE